MEQVVILSWKLVPPLNIPYVMIGATSTPIFTGGQLCADCTSNNSVHKETPTKM